MKFICLVYNDESRLEALPEPELQALIGECVDWVDELERGGHHVASHGLQSTRTATTVRSRGGTVSMTDGPFVETKEQLGGFTIVEARDLNEALRLASRLPAARYGSVEVRPVLEPGARLTTPFDRRIQSVVRLHRPAR